MSAYIGKGKIRLAPFASGDSFWERAFEDIENTSVFRFSFSEQETTLPDYTNAGGGTDASQKRIDAVTGQIDPRHYTAANLARVLWGSSTAVAATPITGEAHKLRLGKFVPTNAPFLSPIGGMVMQQMAGGRSLPFAIEVEYVAGIADAAATYPEMVEAVIKLAMIKVVEDNFMPQSGSISADGLSQSMSVDVSKYHDAFDTIMNGTDGANGGLMSRINGVRMAVF